MTFHHAVVWLDHTKAQVIHFDLKAAESESLKAHSAHPHPQSKFGDQKHANESDNTAFFADIAGALKDAIEILIVGPGDEKTAFKKYLTEHVPAVADKIKGIETVDHPTEGQLLAYARNHFLKAGGLH